MTKLLTKTETSRCLPHQAADEGTSDNVYFWLLVINVQLPEISLWKTRHHLLLPSPLRLHEALPWGPGFVGWSWTFRLLTPLSLSACKENNSRRFPVPIWMWLCSSGYPQTSTKVLFVNHPLLSWLNHCCNKYKLQLLSPHLFPTRALRDAICIRLLRLP